jgi:hypothetical protein
MGIQAIPPAKIGRIRHGKRYENYSEFTTVGDLGGCHWTTWGLCMLDGETGHTPHATLADA